MREMHHSRWSKIGTALAVSSALGLMSGMSVANDKLVELSKSNENWVMQGKDFSGTHYSTAKQINKDNVKKTTSIMVILNRCTQRSRRCATCCRWHNVHSYTIPK